MLHLGDSSTITTSLEDCFNGFPRIDVYGQNEMLVTEDQHLVSVFDMRHKTPLKSWTFSQIKPLSCPAVYDRLRKKYVAILAKNEVRIFGQEEDIDASERFKFKRIICCVLANSCGEPILLFQDGGLSLLTEALAGRSEEINVLHNLENIVLVKVLASDAVSRRGRSAGIVRLIRSGKEELLYNRLNIDCETSIVDRYESFPVPSDCLISSVSEEGAFGGLTADAEVVVVRNGHKSSGKLDIPLDQVSGARAFIFFPKQIDVVGIVHEITADAYVISVIDMRYGTTESQPLESKPLMTGIEFHEDRMFILTAKGIIEKEFRVAPKSLSSIFVGDDADLSHMTPDQRLSKRPQAPDLDFDSMSTPDIIKTMKKQRTGLNHQQNEKRMARLLRHIVKSDPQLQSVSTNQLIEQLLRTPHSPDYLTNELRCLQPRLEAREGLVTASKFLDRADEHDEHTVSCIDICNCILDACFTQILQHKDEFQGLIISLRDKSDTLANYCQSTLHVKAMVDSVIGPAPTRIKPGKPEYELHQIRI